MLPDAIRAGDLAKVAKLLQSAADTGSRGPDGMTPLMIAAGYGQAQIVELLLVAGADVLAIEPRMGASALHKGAQSGNPDVLGLLLDHGAFIDQQSPVLGHTALMDAVVHRHKAAVRLLLARGARTSLRNHWQQNACDLARLEKLDLIADLIEKKEIAAARRLDGMDLAAAIKAGDAAAAEWLIAAGVELDERTPITSSVDDDYTPLGLAARAGRADIVRLLLDAGADPRQFIGLMKGTPLHEAAYHGHANVVQALTARNDEAHAPGTELDAQGPYNGLTALHDAVWHGHEEAAKALVDAGARVDLRTHSGLTPGDMATLYGYDQLARLLGQIAHA